MNHVSLSLKQPNADVVPADGSVGVWFTQAHSCQRDLILAIKQSSLFSPIHVVASHSDLRPEITDVADIAFLEPPREQRVDWLLEHAKRLNVKLVVAGRYGRTYLEAQQRFEQAGIRVMAGCTNPDSLTQLHNKAEFTEICLQHNIAVVPASKVTNADELQAAFNYWASQGEVCVKPVHGVFAAGFWHLDPTVTPFDSFANSQGFKAHPKTFIESYRQLVNPPEYLVMPFLSATECSVDMFCDRGELIQAVARYKHAGDYQSLHLQDPAIELARKVAALFQCDGLVNMQARYADNGKLYILEVNPRPSGGLANTFHSGINIIETAVAYGLGRTDLAGPLINSTNRDADCQAIVRTIADYVRVDI